VGGKSNDDTLGTAILQIAYDQRYIVPSLHAAPADQLSTTLFLRMQSFI
jgi:hypothetical protein